MASVAAPANCTASIGAMQNFGGDIGGALAPTVTGFIVQSTGHFYLAFVTGAVIALVAAAGYWTPIQEPIPAATVGGRAIGGLRAAECDTVTSVER